MQLKAFVAPAEEASLVPNTHRLRAAWNPSSRESFWPPQAPHAHTHARTHAHTHTCTHAHTHTHLLLK